MEIKIEISEKEKKVLSGVLDSAITMISQVIIDEIGIVKKDGVGLDELEKDVEELVTMCGLLVKLSNL